MKRTSFKKNIQSQKNGLYKHLTIEMSIISRLNSIHFAMAVYMTHFHHPEMNILS